MKLKYTILAVFVFVNALPSFSQKKKEVVQYTPILLTNIEEVFPVAFLILNEKYRVIVETLKWGERKIESSFIQYRKTLGMQRLRFEILIDENNTLNVSIPIVEFEGTSGWTKTFVEKREREMQVEFIDAIRTSLNDPATVKRAQEKFYSDMFVNAKFFKTATKLAGDRWFEAFLKDRQVSLKLGFEDIKESPNSQYKTKYAENYGVYLSMISSKDTRFYVTRYTNSDRNVLATKNLSVTVEGHCRELLFTNNTFYIILTDGL